MSDMPQRLRGGRIITMQLAQRPAGDPDAPLECVTLLLRVARPPGLVRVDARRVQELDFPTFRPGALAWVRDATLAEVDGTTTLTLRSGDAGSASADLRIRAAEVVFEEMS